VSRTPSARKKISEMVKRISTRFHPKEIILFGSYARGEGGPNSDADLLVIMSVEGSKRRQAVEIELAVADINMPKDIIVVTPEEARRYGRVPGTVVRQALQEGKVMYERAS